MTDWSRIVQEQGAAVWRTVYRLVGREADAADCFQNVFVSALEVARKQTVENWPALLQRLATARSLECLRRRYRKSDRMTGPLESEPADFRGDGPPAEVAGRELAAELRQALAEIDERQAQVFCLSCLDGRSYREIAEHLGVTVNNVGVLLNRARSNLRERLRAFDPETDAEPAQRGTSR
jgi:RNA polymerase sigma-70 factor, ECF subfamily